MGTELVLDALEMAIWRRAGVLDGLVCHPDAGSQYTSLRYTTRLAEIGAAPSIGTVGDSYGNRLAESTRGLLEAGVMRRPGSGGPAGRRGRHAGLRRLVDREGLGGEIGDI